MPLTGSAPLRRSMPAFNGRPVEARDMGKAYLLTLSADVAEAVSKLAALPRRGVCRTQLHRPCPRGRSPRRPFYNQQWGLQQINMYSLWGEEVISKEGPVIAIIDTGVDIMHPDLQQNISDQPTRSRRCLGLRRRRQRLRRRRPRLGLREQYRRPRRLQRPRHALRRHSRSHRLQRHGHNRRQPLRPHHAHHRHAEQRLGRRGHNH